MRNNTIINCVAGIVGIGALAAMYLSGSGGFAPPVDSSLHCAVGEILARQTLSLLKPGGQVIAIVRDTATFQSPAIDCQVREFTKVLRNAKVTITDMRRLQVDPLRVVEVPGGDFFDLIRKTSEGSVIVSFMGPPVLSDAQIRKLPVTGPGIVAFCSSSDRVDLQRLFEQKILHAAVVPRVDVEASHARPASTQALFAKYYLEVTAANVANVLPSQGRSAITK